MPSYSSWHRMYIVIYQLLAHTPVCPQSSVSQTTLPGSRYAPRTYDLPHTEVVIHDLYLSAAKGLATHGSCLLGNVPITNRGDEENTKKTTV